jgi:hypothetical protein
MKDEMDIVERLRAFVAGDMILAEEAIAEAADEIERLRADSAKWLNRSAELRAEINTQADEAADEIERLRTAAKPFADHDWYDAELEDDSCQLVKHSGNITVGDWKALRRALTGREQAAAEYRAQVEKINRSTDREIDAALTGREDRP